VKTNFMGVVKKAPPEEGGMDVVFYGDRDFICAAEVVGKFKIILLVEDKKTNSMRGGKKAVPVKGGKQTIYLVVERDGGTCPATRRPWWDRPCT
jgi:hypothetical protein